MRSRNVVCSLAIGEIFNEMKSLTLPLIQNYARKIGADFVLFDTEQIHLKDIGFEKYQIRQLLDSYERVLYLDIDLIVKPECPNLFEIVPTEDFAAFLEDKYFIYSEFVDRRKSIVNAQQILGNLGWIKDYFNSGVMVIPRKHKNLFEIPKQYVIDMREQTQLNYDCKRLGIWIHDLDMRFNKMDFLNPLDRFGAYIIHYAGKGFTDRWNDIVSKTILMRQDLVTLGLLDPGPSTGTKTTKLGGK